MGFSLLLSIISSKFKKAALGNRDFRKFLQGYECSIVIKTKDGKKGKRYKFRDGGFSTDGVLDDYDAAMVWKDGKTAVRTMKKGEDGITKAMQNFEVVIDGHLHSFTWFGGALAFVMK